MPNDHSMNNFEKLSVKHLPSALESMEEIRHCMKGKQTAVFLDYDGTLTPIVAHPEEAVLSEDMRSTILELADHCTVAVISGRGLGDVRQRVGIADILYAGSHGFEIAGPEGIHKEEEQARDFLPVLDDAQALLEEALDGIAGAQVERKKFTIAAHYRNVGDEDLGLVKDAVDQVLERYPELRKSYGKKVYELQPAIDWHKGRALLWLLDALDLDQPGALPFYIGDDTTDEDAFEVLKEHGIGIVVGAECRETAARYRLEDTDDVRNFLQELASVLNEV